MIPLIVIVVISAFVAQTITLIVQICLSRVSNVQAKTLIIALLSVSACILISNLFTATFVYHSLGVLAGFDRGMILLIGPLCYLYTKSVLPRPVKISSKNWVHFLPYFFIATPVLQGRISSDRDVLGTSVRQLLNHGVEVTGLDNVYFVFCVLHVGCYIYLCTRNIRMLQQEHLKTLKVGVAKRSEWLNGINSLLMLFFFLFCMITINVAVSGLHRFEFNLVYCFLISLLVNYIAFKSFNNREIVFAGAEVKYASNNLGKNAYENVYEKLNALIKKEKIYLEYDVSLSKVAKRLQVHPNIVSQVVNERFGFNFNEWINNNRIEAFKELVAAHHHKKFSVMGLAYEVGFKSKSAFYMQFKKMVGLTPIEYINNQNL